MIDQFDATFESLSKGTQKCVRWVVSQFEFSPRFPGMLVLGLMNEYPASQL